jgi:translation initiation factor 4A
MEPVIKDEINYQEIDYDNFDDFLCEYHEGNLLRGIYGYGFEKPSLIQAKAIQPILDGKDLIAQAQSGSGKTGAFTIAAISKVDAKINKPQIIIIANTRELALQIVNVASELAKYTGIKISACIGGQTGKDAQTNLKEAHSSHILIGTPGRLADLIERDGRKKGGSTLFNELKLFVLDEADALLGSDFLQQIYVVIKKLPKTSQIALFSATFLPETLELTSKFMNNPVRILVEREKVSVDLIKNFFVDIGREEHKYAVLVELYQKVSVCQAVIFVNSIRKAIDVSERLRYDGHAVGTIHAKLNDVERNDVLKNFRKTQTRILVATDIISRGIDVQQVGLVVNYDVPFEAEHYIHRVGRSGRYGKLGVAITLTTNHHMDYTRMENIESTYSIRFSPLPGLEEINNLLTGMKGYIFSV